MPLRVGDPLPAFRASDQDGRTWTDESLRGRPFVLYFYPKDETPGCIAQGCAYRDAWADFERLGVPVLGVSRDSPESHRAFAQRRRLPFPLLADEDGALHRAFRARILFALPRRISYLVSADGRIAQAFESHLHPEAHAEEMLEAAKHLVRK